MSETCQRVLDVLGLAGALPEPRIFEELFLRFGRRMPLQGARGARRDTDTVLEAWMEAGWGTWGAERTRTLLALARTLGFDVVPVSGRLLPAAAPHSALLARLEGRVFLADTAFPLPSLLPIEPLAADIPSAWGSLSLRPGDGQLRLVVEAWSEVRERAEYGLAAVPEASLDAGPPGDGLLRLLDDRILRWQDGTLSIEDAWSRLTTPLPAAHREDLESLFAQPLPPRLGEGEASESSRAEPALVVFHAAEIPSAELAARLAGPEGLLLLEREGTTARDVVLEAGGFSWRLHGEDGAFLRAEKVEPGPAGFLAEVVEGSWPFRARKLRLEDRGGETRLILEATLAGPVPPRGPAEGVRKTLVFLLAAELVALVRALAPGF